MKYFIPYFYLIQFVLKRLLIGYSYTNISND